MFLGICFEPKHLSAHWLWPLLLFLSGASWPSFRWSSGDILSAIILPVLCTFQVLPPRLVGQRKTCPSWNWEKEYWMEQLCQRSLNSLTLLWSECAIVWGVSGVLYTLDSHTRGMIWRWEAAAWGRRGLGAIVCWRERQQTHRWLRVVASALNSVETRK